MRTPPTRAALLALALALPACAPSRGAPVAGPEPAPQPVPELLGSAPEAQEEAPRPAPRDILGGLSYDLPVESNSWVEAELDFLVGQRREVIGRWIARGDFYEPFVKEVLRANGVPTDLYHLAMIESGFVPTVRSHAGAVGLWQFMPATGRGMGLRVDDTVDERMDPVRSTRAAARHLRALRQSMGDWALAAAAYNAGSGRITRGLQAYAVRDFWSLAQQGNLAQETRQYVPRLYAMTVIARGRERFGFAAAATQSRFAFDSIQVEYATPLEELATIAGVERELLGRLNPHLVRGITPSGGYWVWVPDGRGSEIQRAWLASDFRREHGYGRYEVRPGDQLGKLAELSGVRASRIRELNPSVDFDELQIGESLRLPYRAAQQLAARPVEKEKNREKEKEKDKEKEESDSYVAARRSGRESDGDRHVVADGESLWAIAERYGVSVAALQKANDLDGSTIRPGDELKLPGAARRGADRPKESSRKARAERREHVVKSGDTLWGIAQRYGTSVEAIQEANRLGSRPIRPGQKLSVPSAD